MDTIAHLGHELQNDVASRATDFTHKKVEEPASPIVLHLEEKKFLQSIATSSTCLTFDAATHEPIAKLTNLSLKVCLLVSGK